MSFLIIAFPPQCIFGRWGFGDLLVSCSVQAPEQARTLVDALALAEAMWETGLLGSGLHRESTGSGSLPPAQPERAIVLDFSDEHYAYQADPVCQPQTGQATVTHCGSLGPSGG